MPTHMNTKHSGLPERTSRREQRIARWVKTGPLLVATGLFLIFAATMPPDTAVLLDGGRIIFGSGLIGYSVLLWIVDEQPLGLMLVSLVPSASIIASAFLDIFALEPGYHRTVSMVNTMIFIVFVVWYAFLYRKQWQHG